MREKRCCWKFDKAYKKIREEKEPGEGKTEFWACVCPNCGKLKSEIEEKHTVY